MAYTNFYWNSIKILKIIYDLKGFFKVYLGFKFNSKIQKIKGDNLKKLFDIWFYYKQKKNNKLKQFIKKYIYALDIVLCRNNMQS